MSLECLIKQVDEIQFLLPLDGIEVHRHNTIIYHFSKILMETAVACSSMGVFFLPIFSGTLPLNRIGLFALTQFKITPVFLPVLKVPQSLDLVRKEMQKRGVNTLKILETDGKKLVSLMGPFPRYLQVLCETLQHAHQDNSVEQIYEDCRYNVLQRLNASPPTWNDKQITTFLYALFTSMSYRYQAC